MQQPKQLGREDYVAKLKKDYEDLFSTGTGKRVLEDVKKSAFIHTSSFNSDALQMAFNEGKREMALHLIFMSTPLPETKEQPKAITGDAK